MFKSVHKWFEVNDYANVDPLLVSLASLSSKTGGETRSLHYKSKCCCCSISLENVAVTIRSTYASLLPRFIDQLQSIFSSEI